LERNRQRGKVLRRGKMDLKKIRRTKKKRGEGRENNLVLKKGSWSDGWRISKIRGGKAP